MRSMQDGERPLIEPGAHLEAILRASDVADNDLQAAAGSLQGWPVRRNGGTCRVALRRALANA